MKRVAMALGGVVLALLGVLIIPNLFYNLAGFFGIQDGADGPKWVCALFVMGCTALASAAFFLSTRLLRLAATSPPKGMT